MDISPETLRSLKQINVSADKENTIKRVRQLWSETSARAKKQVLERAKTGSATIYRIFKTGAITPRIALVLASSLDADPFYLTGEAPEDTGFSMEKLERFLSEKGLGQLQSFRPAQDALFEGEAAPLSEAQEDGAFANLSEEAYTLQLRALFQRAAINEVSKAKLKTIRDILFKD